mgnify:FL=1
MLKKAQGGKRLPHKLTGERKRKRACRVVQANICLARELLQRHLRQASRHPHIAQPSSQAFGLNGFSSQWIDPKSQLLTSQGDIK